MCLNVSSFKQLAENNWEPIPFLGFNKAAITKNTWGYEPHVYDGSQFSKNITFKGKEF